MKPIQRYVHRKMLLLTTSFIIDKYGNGYYRTEDGLVPRKEFEKKHDVSVIPRVNFKGENPAVCQRWMNNDMTF